MLVKVIVLTTFSVSMVTFSMQNHQLKLVTDIDVAANCLRASSA